MDNGSSINILFGLTYDQRYVNFLIIDNGSAYPGKARSKAKESCNIHSSFVLKISNSHGNGLHKNKLRNRAKMSLQYSKKGNPKHNNDG